MQGKLCVGCFNHMCESLSNPSCRCFTFGIGSGASTTLVEGLARAGNGTAEFVKEGERMQPKVFLCFVQNTQNMTHPYYA